MFLYLFPPLFRSFTENSAKGNIYLGILKLLSFSQIQYTDIEKETAAIFLQGGAPCHFTLTVRHALIASFLFHGLGDVNQ
jgi:hypothetical protein